VFVSGKGTEGTRGDRANTGRLGERAVSRGSASAALSQRSGQKQAKKGQRTENQTCKGSVKEEGLPPRLRVESNGSDHLVGGVIGR